MRRSVSVSSISWSPRLTTETSSLITRSAMAMVPPPGRTRRSTASTLASSSAIANGFST
jgi:hypothetical protein